MKDKLEKILEEVGKVIKGKDAEKEMILAAILAEGHILLDDIPGVGKTSLAMAFSKAMEMQANRMQFTSDVLPSDVVGYNIIKPDGSKEYQRGVILCNLFLADEINRASSKTQSALLEVMEEGKVTVDGITTPAPKPFVVMATENPAGSVGTQMLPDSQVDRFMICLTLGYPSHSEEVMILKERQGINPINSVIQVVERQELLEMQQMVKAIHLNEEMYDYIVKLAGETRTHSSLTQGLSPRGTIALMDLSKAVAFMEERDCVFPEDVKKAFPYVARHRIYLTAKAKMEKKDKDQIIKEVLDSVKAVEKR